MMNGITPVANVGNNDMFNNPIWALVFLAFLGGGGIGGFGGGREQYATSADVQRGFDTSAVTNKLNGLENGVSSLGFTLSNTITSGNFATQQSIADLGYAVKDCCCAVNRNIDSVKQEICSQTNTLANAIHHEGEQTRALINAQEMARLREENSGLKLSASQQAQTSNILNSLGRYVTNPACPVTCCGF